jgi:HPt (histidine-containing phosphotransfer) domain-containing protein
MDDLPIIDRARLELITRGNTARADEFMGALLEESEEIIVRLRTLIAGADIDRTQVSDAAHTLKGMAAEVGASRLRAAAFALEGEVDPARWPGQLSAVTVALAELSSHLAANGERDDRSDYAP